MIRKIIPTTDPSLRIKSKPITVFDKRVVNLAKDLKDTLQVQKDPEGVGLAACQIGKNLRIFAMEYQKGIKIIVNPKILAVSTKKQKPRRGKKAIMEGCLSIPNYYGPLKRPQRVKLQYQDILGRKQVDTFEGFAAQIIQHEVDHLNGILFVDHLIKEGKSLYELTKEGWEEVNLL